MIKHLSAPGVLERLLLFGAGGISGFVAIRFGHVGRDFVAGVLFWMCLAMGRMLLARRRLAPRAGGALLCRYDMQLDPAGMHIQTPNWTFDMPWHGVIAVEETSAHCFIRIDTASAYTVPKRAFADVQSVRRFIDFARECAARAHAPKDTRADGWAV